MQRAALLIVIESDKSNCVCSVLKGGCCEPEATFPHAQSLPKDRLRELQPGLVHNNLVAKSSCDPSCRASLPPSASPLDVSFLMVGSPVSLVIASKLPAKELRRFSLPGRRATPTDESGEEELPLYSAG